MVKEEQVFDVHYDDFIKDPIALIKRIYEYYGLNYTVDFENRMRVCSFLTITFLMSIRNILQKIHKESMALINTV